MKSFAQNLLAGADEKKQSGASMGDSCEISSEIVPGKGAFWKEAGFTVATGIVSGVVTGIGVKLLLNKVIPESQILKLGEAQVKTINGVIDSLGQTLPTNA